MTGRSSVIRVSVLGDASDLSRAMKSGEKSTKSFADKSKEAGQKVTRNVTLPLIGAAAGLIHLSNTQEDAERKMESTFRSMGAAAWTNTDALKANASALQEQSTFGDEAIIGLQDLLLTFGNVTNKIGEGNDIFDQATQLGLDMSAALGQDLKASAIQLGKALNDPITGITALSRVGVTFTEDQKETIKTMTEMGDVTGAQKVILAELERQFSGTAKAMTETSKGKMTQAMNTLGDIGETIGKVLGSVAAEAIPNLVSGVGVVKDFVESLPGPVKVAVLAIGGITLALAALSAHPVVAGLAGVVALINEIGSAAADREAAVSDFKSIIEEVGEAGSDTARQLLEARDSTGEMSALAAEAGLTLDDLADSINGDENALRKMEDALQDATTEGRLHELQANAVRNAVDVLGESMQQAQTDIDNVAEAERIATREAEAAASSQMELAARTGEMGAATGEAVGPVDDLTGSVDLLESATSEAEQATIDLADQQRKAADPLFALRSAQEKFREKLAEVTQLEREGKTATQEYEDAQYDLVDASGDLRYAEEKYKATADITLEAFIAAAKRAGLTKDEIDQLTRAYKNLDGAARNAGRSVGGSSSGLKPGSGVLEGVDFQTGGIVPGPTGSKVAATLEAGEIVLNPQQQRSLLRGGGNGGGLTVNVSAGTIVTESELEDLIIRVMARYGLRNGR